MVDIHEATRSGDLERVRELIAADSAAMNSPDDLGWYPIHIAIEKGCLDIVDLLLKKKAKVNVRTQDGEDNTPLHLAALYCFPEIVELLLSRGADPNRRADDGYTPLHVAASDGHLDIARFLLSHEADPNVMDDSSDTPLQVAAHNGHKPVVELLIENGGKLNSPGGGGAPLVQAASKGQREVVEVLLARGADVNVASKHRWSALHWAAWNCDAEMIMLLLSHGADINCRTSSGWTPGYPKIHQALRDVWDVRCARGWSPLHLAAIQGNVETMELLIANGAEVDAKGDKRRTPLWWAKTLEKTDAVECLRRQMADF